MIRKKHQPTQAQKIYGKAFDNTQILCERPTSMRSVLPDEDKALFKQYRHALRQQVKVIKHVLR